MESKTLLKSFMVTTLILMLSITIYAPVVSASPKKSELGNVQWVVDEESYKEAIVTVNGEEYYFTVRLYGDTWKIDSINGVEQASNWIQFGVKISRPPYPWFIPMGSVSSFRTHLDAATAPNVQTALAVLSALLGIAASYGGSIAIVGAAISALIFIGYSTLYTDHHSDGSWDLWVPYDWYNVLVAGTGAGVYMATCRWWWFAYLRAIPFKVTSHSYWY